MTTATDCPCGSGKALSACCGPYITGKSQAPTAEALMRARYSAYAIGNIEFVESTLAPESRSDFDRKASEKWSLESKWGGLQIVATKDGGPKDETGVVRFIARYSTADQHFEHHEIATFRKEKGAWYFVDGKSPKPETFVNAAPAPGRNDPCHCGSGKKFKKCHGAAA